MYCSRCYAWIPDDAVFCSECGQPVTTVAYAPVATGYCAVCGAPLMTEDMFCGNCGAQNPMYGQNYDVAGNEGKKKLDFKSIAKYAAIGAAVVVLAIIASLFLGDKTDSYLVYVKDREFQVAEMPKANDPVQLTDRLSDDRSVTNQNINSAITELSNFVALSSDGKTIFYPDKIDDGYSLYYRDVTNKKKEPVKIDSGLEEYYFLNDAGNLITYMKNENLYQHDLTEKNKIAGDVHDYVVSNDGKTLLYLKDYSYDDGGQLYLKKGKDDAAKIASGVSSIRYADDDLSMVLYMKDDALYRVENGKDPEKIASDVYGTYSINESGSFYYTTREDSYITYGSIITNDTSYEMGDFADRTLENPIKTLYYFDGKKSVLITEAMLSFYDWNSENKMFAYTALADNELPNVRLSDYTESDASVEELLEEAINEELASYVAIGGKIVKLALDEVSYIDISNDGSTLYVRADYDDEDGTYRLYKITLSGTKVKDSVVLDDEVGTVRLAGNHVLYWKDMKNGEGELYMDGEKIADDATTRYTFDKETDSLYFLSDYDDDDGEGTLICWDGKKKSNIADEVRIFKVDVSGQVVYLRDYSTKRYEGELYKWNGKKSVMLDEDVVNFFLIKN